jgi:RNA polymerase sigma-B factor
LTNNIKQIRLPANLAGKKDIDFKQPISSDIIVDEDDGTTLIQKIPDELNQEIDYSHLSKVINILTKKEQEIIRLRFIQDMTLQEIGDELDLTKEAIRVNLNKILKKLKDKIDLKQIYF